MKISLEKCSCNSKYREKDIENAIEMHLYCILHVFNVMNNYFLMENCIILGLFLMFYMPFVVIIENGKRLLKKLLKIQDNFLKFQKWQFHMHYLMLFRMIQLLGPIKILQQYLFRLLITIPLETAASIAFCFPPRQCVRP